MTSKQRAALRSLASTMDAIFQVGKENLTQNQIKGIGDALDARELVKITVLRNSELELNDAAEELAHRTRSTVVCVIGSKIVLYKRSTKKDIKHIEF